MFPFNSSQRAAFDGLRREFEHAIGVPPEMPRGVAFFDSDVALTVEIDLPGVAKSDIELSLSKGVLRIKAERVAPEISATGGKDFRSFGKLEHVSQLGSAVDPSGLDAVCQDGVLRTTLTKAVEQPPTRIDVRDEPGSQN